MAAPPLWPMLSRRLHAGACTPGAPPARLAVWNDSNLKTDRQTCQGPSDNFQRHPKLPKGWQYHFESVLPAVCGWRTLFPDHACIFRLM